MISASAISFIKLFIQTRPQYKVAFLKFTSNICIDISSSS